LGAVLIETKLKKAIFLREAIKKLNLENRAEVINKQFQEIEKPNVEFITCRALDKFAQKIPKLLKWGKNSNFILFGGNSIRKALKELKINYEERLLPFSTQRFLFFIKTN
jgi:16S rRNA G527 N7-methylase RsmG